MAFQATGRRSPLVAALLLAVIGAALLWPVAAGGSLAYVATRGGSMEPAFSRGDLAVVRPADDYRVGDVAAYRNAQLGRLVVHRIVAVEGDRYTFKGDANAFQDPQPVRRSQIVGRVSLRIPAVGGVLLWLATPVNALLLTMLVLLVVWDRHRLLRLVSGRPARSVDVPAVHDTQPGPAAPAEAVPRILRISAMSFPPELAVADVVAVADLMALAERYDQPVLHDLDSGLLYVVESSTLFRHRPTQALEAGPPLAVVRDLAPAGPAKKAPAEKASARKAPAKAPARKAPAKKAPAKKAPAKKASSG